MGDVGGIATNMNRGGEVGGRPASVMAKRAITFVTVRKMALALPGAEERISWGVPAFYVSGRMFACQPTHRSAEPGSLVVRIGFDERADLLEAEPDIYYLPEHYVNYTSVLVRLSRVHPDAMRDLLAGAHRFMSTPTRRAKRPAARTRR